MDASTARHVYTYSVTKLWGQTCCLHRIVDIMARETKAEKAARILAESQPTELTREQKIAALNASATASGSTVKGNNPVREVEYDITDNTGKVLFTGVYRMKAAAEGESGYTLSKEFGLINSRGGVRYTMLSPVRLA